MPGRTPAACSIALLLLVVAAAPSLAHDLGGDSAVPTPATISREVTVIGMEDRQPVAGAVVEAMDLPGGPVKKTTGTDGRVRFEDTPAGSVTFVVRAAGRPWATFKATARPMFGVRGAANGGFDGVRSIPVMLMEGTVLEGRVVSSIDGNPVSGVRVEGRDILGRLCPLRGEEEIPPFDETAIPLWVATTGADGRFRTDQAPYPYPDRLRYVRSWVLAGCAGWCSDEVEIPRTNEGIAPVDLRLRPAGVIRGRVLRKGGSPAVGALVQAHREAAPAPPGHWWVTGPLEGDRAGDLRTRTRDDGRYEFPEALVGARYTLLAEEEGPLVVGTPGGIEDERRGIEARSAPVPGVTVAAQGGVATRDLVLHHLGTLVVKVDFEGGDIGVGLTVDLRPPAGGRDPGQGSLFDGGFHWIELVPGVYSIRADAGGWRPLRQPVEVGVGEDVQVTVHPDRGVSLEGLVVDEKGVPLQGIRLFASPVDPADPRRVLDESEEAWSEDDGTFRFDGLRPGPVAIVLGEGIKPYLLDGPFRATAPATGVRIAIRHQ